MHCIVYFCLTLPRIKILSLILLIMVSLGVIISSLLKLTVDDK